MRAIIVMTGLSLFLVACAPTGNAGCAGGENTTGKISGECLSVGDEPFRFAPGTTLRGRDGG